MSAQLTSKGLMELKLVIPNVNGGMKVVLPQKIVKIGMERSITQNIKMTHQGRRKHRVNWILNYVTEANKAGGIIEEEILISELCIELGAGRRYIKEILKDLVNTKRLIIEFGEVWNPIAYETQKITERGEN